ncbi:DNA cytosine methyltransferase [Brevibacillus brevis]|uniref:DNA (cytosine-5-)-methyltransferase n=1 Tax=Brevibacillus brevis TaxID=1393 RepID=A0ABY9TDC2_BREBE|nr:DNA cytosine methyltransferase [Brevibacillus brevis]WNC17929.1 DNA cytosine methyltransferase [Brevibacillus brevis]
MLQIPVGSLFSGAVDGMAQGFEMASDCYNVILSNEIDPSAVKTHQLNYSHRIIADDIRKVSVDNYLDVREGVLVGTFPCVEYSLAANIHKKKRESNWKQAYHHAMVQDLFLHFFRYVALIQPEVYLWENSPEVRKFPIVMETFRKLPPYDYYEMELDTKDFRLPQRRKRLFVIGFKRRFTPVSPLYFQEFNRQLTIGDIREENPVIDIPDYVKKRIDGGYRDLPSVKADHDIGNTCVAHYARDRGTTLIYARPGEPNYKGLRPFTNREYARQMGIPDAFQFANATTTNFKHIGNSVSPIVVKALAKMILPYFGEKTA